MENSTNELEFSATTCIIINIKNIKKRKEEGINLSSELILQNITTKT